jgi:branched-chain amino acid transport system ATP-binding protein
MTGNIVLSARGLVIRFGGVIAADGVDLDVLDGEHLAIIGPNGAGKTTFLNIATGYLKPQAGRVAFLGEDITAHSPRAITRLGIARAFQIPQLFLDHTVIESLLIAAASRAGRFATMRDLHDLPEREEMMRLLALVQADDVAHQRAIVLPEGKRKLIDIAMALALRPKLVLMDEPTSGVASAEKFAIMDVLVAALDAQGVTSVFVEHDMEVVERYADRVAVWSAGRIQTSGPPAEVLKDPTVVSQVIGI